MPAFYSSNGTVATGTTSVTPGTPASLADGDGVLVVLTIKPDTASVTTPTGWTLVGTVSGGGGTSGNGTGPTEASVYFREKTSGWTSVPAFTITSGTASAGMAIRMTKTAGEAWDVAMATGVFGTAATTTNASTTMGSNPGITANDLLVGFVTNQSATPTWSAQSITATGATIGAATERSEAIENATNPTTGGMLFTATCTAGTATANPVSNATASAATRGTSSVIRVRASVPVDYTPRTPPTWIVGFGPTTNNYAINTSPKTATVGAALQVGDRLSLIASAENGQITNATPTDNTSGAITWTPKGSISSGDANNSGMYTWEGVVGSAVASGAVITVTTTGSAISWGFNGNVWRGATGMYLSGVASADADARVTFTSLRANSALTGQINDWNATNVSTRSWLSINGAAITETVFYSNPGVTHTVVGGRHPDLGSGGSVTWGLNTPASGYKAAVGVLEVFGEIPSGTAASATGALSLSGTAGAAGRAVATGALDLSGTAGARATAAASGTLSLSGAGTAGVPPVAASASGALDLSGTAGARGTVAASGSLTLSGSGGARGAVVASGALTLSGTAGATSSTTASGSLTLSGTAGARATASASGSLSLSGTGSADPVLPGEATASGSLSLSGTAGGVARTSATGALTLTGTAGAVARASATGSLTLSASGGGGARAAASGSLSLSGLASSNGEFPASATGSLSLSGSAAGAARAAASGSLSLSGGSGALAPSAASGSLSLVGSAVSGARAPASGSLTLVGSAAAGSRATATGVLTLSGSATAGQSVSAAATGVLSLSGYVVLTRPPDLFNPRGSIRTNLARGTIRSNATGRVRREYARGRVRT